MLLSSKIVCLSIGSWGFRHELRGGFNTIARRRFATSPRNRGSDESSAHEHVLNGMAPGNLGPAQGTSTISFTNEQFHALDKDVTILKVQMNDVKSSLKDLTSKVDKGFDHVNKKIDTKFDRLMLLIIGGVVLKGGFDFYRDERKNSASRKEV